MSLAPFAYTTNLLDLEKFRKYFKRSRTLLIKPTEKLTQGEMERLALMFEISPRLADACRVRNESLSMVQSDSSEVGRQHLLDWPQSVEVMDLPEFKDCTGACYNWFTEILNSMDVPRTNGFVEGCNYKGLEKRVLWYA